MTFSLLIAWRVTPAHFSCEAFCELRMYQILGSSHSSGPTPIGIPPSDRVCMLPVWSVRRE